MRQLFFLIFLLLSFPANAHEEIFCSDQKTTVGIVNCLDEKVEFLEEDLEVIENQTLSRFVDAADLYEEVDVINDFKESQKDFQIYKTSQCIVARNLVLGGTAMPINRLACEANLIKSRIEFFKARLGITEEIK